MKFGDLIGNAIDTWYADNVEQCRDRCSEESDCCVFIYSHAKKTCDLWMECEPNNPQGQVEDQMFCRKSKLYTNRDDGSGQ